MLSIDTPGLVLLATFGAFCAVALLATFCAVWALALRSSWKRMKDRKHRHLNAAHDASDKSRRCIQDLQYYLGLKP